MNKNKNGSNKNESDTNKTIQELKDFEIMKKIQNGECKIEDFDNETKVRLIALCTQRSNEMTEKLKDLYRKNRKSN